MSRGEPRKASPDSHAHPVPITSDNIYVTADYFGLPPSSTVIIGSRIEV